MATSSGHLEFLRLVETYGALSFSKLSLPVNGTLPRTIDSKNIYVSSCIVHFYLRSVGVDGNCKDCQQGNQDWIYL